jgi:ubiquinone biosynthesis protein
MAMTELGTTLIKLGQMLSTRADLIGPEMAAELAQLQSNVPAESAESARQLIENDLGATLEDLFASFDETPMAAASIAQVYGAVLPSGERVAVKVRRTGIESRVITDLEIVQLLAELIESQSASVRTYQPVAIVRQFRRTLMRELDFTYEKRNLEEFALHFGEDPNVCIPRVYADLCSHQIVTMDRLDGIPGTDIEALKASGEDLSEFARRGANMYLEMVFRDGFYHSDPHPGNLILLPGNVVGVVDCGQVGRIGPQRGHGHRPTAGQHQHSGHASCRRMRVAAVPALPFGPQ